MSAVVVAVLLGETSKLRLFNFRVEKRSFDSMQSYVGTFRWVYTISFKGEKLKIFSRKCCLSSLLYVINLIH